MRLQHLQERIQFGRGQRERLSRTRHALLNSAERIFDPLEVLLAADRGRVRSLLPLKYGRMARSPFSFYRGAVSIMAADMARLPRTELDAQLCGDTHMLNLGSFASPDGSLTFDLNDFDETIRGPWEWDVKRMAASINLAGREASQTQPRRRAAVVSFVENYCQSIKEFAHRPILKVARHAIDRREGGRPIRDALRQSERNDPMDLLRKYTERNGRGERRFEDRSPWSGRVTGERASHVRAALKKYRECLSPDRRHLFDLFRLIDVGYKVAGTGGIGLRNYVALLEGNGLADPLFLQLKEEKHSAWAALLPDAVYEHQGRRVAEGQRAVQPVSDLMLGWTAMDGAEYMVRQLSDHKGSIEVESLRGGGLESLAIVAGELLARGHARSGDACAIHGYCGSGAKLARAIREFATLYSDQTESDYEKFIAAIKRKNIPYSEEALRS